MPSQHLLSVTTFQFDQLMLKAITVYSLLVQTPTHDTQPCLKLIYLLSLQTHTVILVTNRGS